MRRISIAAMSVIALTGSLLMAASPAYASDRVCRGTLGGISVSGGVVVPSGATCILNGTRVDGDVKVQGSGAVLITGGARIDGNVQAEDGRARYVRVRGSSVLGNVQVKSGGRVVVRQTTVAGNIQVDRNRGQITVLGNTVDGDIQLFTNSARAEIRNNHVGGNLQCKQNSPSPVGSGNQVAGAKEDQCRSM
jgi:cytoskeletal protein CcmA (bactofilin family)